MKAIVTKKYGNESVLEFKKVNKPVIAENEALIKIDACSVNPVDWKIRSGKIMIKTGLKPPQILGSDFAGTIVELGHNFKGYQLQDKVWGKVDSFKGGAYAQYIKVKVENITLMPNNINEQQAASVPNVALTAYQALFKQVRLKKGQKVLINGASGGVGLMALQIAKAHDCHVTAVCSGKNAQLIKELGADKVIDYTKEKILDTKGQYHVFFDSVANLSLLKVASLLLKKATYIRTTPSLESLFFAPILRLLTGKWCKHIMVKPSHQDLLSIKQMIESNRLKPVVAQVFNAKEVARAHKLSARGHVAGKLVLDFTE